MKDLVRILWLDCLGGLAVGVIVVAFCWPISNWEGLPLVVVLAMGMVNLAYGSFSLYVTTRKNRPLSLIKILAIANMFWLLVCCVIVVVHWNQISILGILHLIGEGIYVAALGKVEWKLKDSLATA